MNPSHLERKVRRVSRCLGVDVSIIRSEHGTPERLETTDTDGRTYTTFLGPPSKWGATVSEHHEIIYRMRAKRVYRAQDGKCAHCAISLRGCGECDHIKSRGANGRDDRIENLRILCSPCHRVRHGEKTN